MEQMLDNCYENDFEMGQQNINEIKIQKNESNKNGIKLPILNRIKQQRNKDSNRQDNNNNIAIFPHKTHIISQTNQQLPNVIVKYGTNKRKVEKKKNKIIVEIKPQIQQRYKQYQMYLSLLNLSNNLKINITQQIPLYNIYVGKGNNSTLIKTLFNNYRPWWNIIEQNSIEKDLIINLSWYQLKQNNILDDFKSNIRNENQFQHTEIYLNQDKDIKLKQKNNIISNQLTNRKTFQIRSCSMNQNNSTRSKIILNINKNKRSSSKNKVNKSIQKIFNTQNLYNDIKEQELLINFNKKKILPNPKMWPIYQNYRKILSSNDLKQIKKLNIIDCQGKIYYQLLRNNMRFIQNRSNYIRMHNHLVNNWNLSNKKALFTNMKSYYHAKGINPFDYIPMTFHVTNINSREFEEFQSVYQHRMNIIDKDEKNKRNHQNQFKYTFKPRKRNAWLVKPGQNTNRGTGIEVKQDIEEIKEMIQNQKKDSQGRQRTHIIQEYITPFLYQKRKFDIRTYILITSINGYQKGYWYQDGYIRTASKQFNMKNLNNKYIHLTNDAVQKKCDDYGKYENDNKLSYGDFQRYLDSGNNNCIDNTNTKLKFWHQAYPEMKRISIDAIKSVYSKLNPTKKQFTFQIFGLDFLIDQNFKVWLIQANTNPCLEVSCPLLSRIIPIMLENAFRIVVDPIFPPPTLSQINNGKKFTLPDNQIECNKFQLVFDQAQEGKDLLVLTSNFPEVKIYGIEQEEQQYEEEEDKKNQQ